MFCHHLIYFFSSQNSFYADEITNRSTLATIYFTIYLGLKITCILYCAVIDYRVSETVREDDTVVVRTIMFRFCFQPDTHTHTHLNCLITEWWSLCWSLHWVCVCASQTFFLFG